MDGEGWHLLDCRPSVFAKILDVLRMRKRALWAENDWAHENKLVYIEIKAGDRQSFEKFVDMYFPGCEDFIMDCVESPEVIG